MFPLPPPSSIPPVAGYKISHNTTGSVLVNQTNYITFVVESGAPGVYLFTVLLSIYWEMEKKKPLLSLYQVGNICPII